MIGYILGIFGILLTVGFGVYSIWAYKKSKRVVSLEFRNEQCYSLFRDDVTRLNIDIVYNKKTLSNPLILLKAKLVNNGQIDIDKNRIFKPLKIISTKEFIWLEARPKSQPIGSTVNISILNQNELQIDWDLLKSSEYIEFEALVEITDNIKLDTNKTLIFYNGISFDYRITDLKNVQKEKKTRRLQGIDIIVKYSNPIAIFALIFGISILVTEYYPNLQYLPGKLEIIYNLDKGDSILKGNIYSKRKDLIIFKPSDSSKKITLSVENFNKDYKIESIEKTNFSKGESLINKILGILLIISGIRLFYLNFRLKNKIKAKALKQNKSVK